MNNKIFICYSSKDEAVAKLVCEMFEEEGLPCWIAPRDMPPGGRYSTEIVKAINNCKAFIFIFSKNSINSTPVFAEVESAFSKGKPVFPFRIQNIEPGKDFELFLKIFQWCDGFEPPIENKIKEMLRAIKENLSRPSEPATLQPTISGFISESEFINNAYLPFASLVKDSKEHEISNNIEGSENTLVRFIELFTKFLVFTMVAGFNKNYVISEHPDILKLLLNLKYGKRNSWFPILESLINFHSKEKTPFLQSLILFLESSIDISKELRSSYTILSEKIAEDREYSETMLDLIFLLNKYSEAFLNKGFRIENPKEHIKDTLLVLISKSPFSNDLEFFCVLNVFPNKIERKFKHILLSLSGTEPKTSNSALITENWEIIDNYHVVLINKENQNAYLDLFPYIIYDEKTKDILFWEKTLDFREILYKSVVVKNIVEITLKTYIPFLEELKKISEAGFILPSEITDFGELVVSLSNVKKHLTEIVTNPICLKKYITSLEDIENRIENQVDKINDQSIYSDLKARIELIKNKSMRGVYPKLETTECNYILLDENKGKYIVPDLFFNENEDAKTRIKELSTIFKKEIDSSVGTVLYLAMLESKSEGTPTYLGVEHLVIGISKICDEIILNWYDSIGVSPKYHRDMIRYAIKKRKEQLGKKNGGFIIRDRVEKVFDMAIREVNLAKKAQISLIDLFSAILREGESLPIRLLLNLFDLTNDRLLSDFYLLIRQR